MCDGPAFTDIDRVASKSGVPFSSSYGEAQYALERRKGLRISSALAESAMSHLVNQRMGKRQPNKQKSTNTERPHVSDVTI